MRKIPDIKRRADEDSDLGIPMVKVTQFLLVGNCIILFENLGIFRKMNPVEGLYGS